MDYKVNNTLTRVGKTWKFTGQLIDGNKTIPVSGRVNDFKTMGMIKRAILTQMDAFAEKHTKPTSPKELVLSEDDIFMEL